MKNLDSLSNAPENYISLNLHLPIDVQKVKALISRYMWIALVFLTSFFWQFVSNSLKSTEVSSSVPINEKTIIPIQGDESNRSMKVERNVAK